MEQKYMNFRFKVLVFFLTAVYLFQNILGTILLLMKYNDYRNVFHECAFTLKYIQTHLAKFQSPM